MKVLLSKDEISKRVKELGSEIKESYGDEHITCVVVLKGSFIFASDLVREIESNNISIEFVQLSSYRGMNSTGEVDMLMGDLQIFKSKNVLIVEDIVDTGLTLSFFMELLNKVGVNSMKVCSLLEKYEIHQGKIGIDFLGFKIPDKFVIGYGLDYDEKYRNLPYIGVFNE